MSKRLYQIIALAILVVAPVVVHLLSTFVPGAQPTIAATQSNAAERVPPVAVAQTAQSQFARPPEVPAFDTDPSLDAQGITPEASAGDAAIPAYQPPPPREAAPPVVTTPALHPDDNPGPPPSRKPDNERR